MIKDTSTKNWTFSTEDQTGLWHLIYDDDKNVISFFKSNGITSTQENLFVGNEIDCNIFIYNEGLKIMTSETSTEE